jgi:hypothetical protein
MALSRMLDAASSSAESLVSPTTPCFWRMDVTTKAIGVTGEKVRGRRPETFGELTAQERQIAELARG